MKKIIAAAGIFSILSFPCTAFSAEEIIHHDLKQITGQAGIVFELGEVFLRVNHNDVRYPKKEEGLAKVGVKVLSDNKGTLIHFKPITNIEQYTRKNILKYVHDEKDGPSLAFKDVNDYHKFSNINLKKIFGDKIGNIGLKENNIENKNAELNKANKKDNQQSTENKEVSISDLVIQATRTCPLFTSIGLFNTGLIGITNFPLLKTNLNSTGIVAELPTVEGYTGRSTRSIVIFSEDPTANIMNNNQTLLTIEKGPSTQIIFGGHIEVRPITDRTAWQPNDENVFELHRAMFGQD
jgi:hypothetical protein